jgi:Icc-related predicted phosphoesterase
MRLHILNDLHIEFGSFEPPAVGADVTVLAGDIGVGDEGLRWAALRFQGKHVIYVPGNHEFYHHDIDLVAELRQVAPPNIHVLNDDQVIIDGVRFLGSILWTDFALSGGAGRVYSMQQARRTMNDFALIRHGGRVFTPEQSILLHQHSRCWLESRLAEPFEGMTVIVTHHAPSAHSVPPRYSGHPLAPAFASDLENLMDGRRVALWVHGHVHDPFDYELIGTRVVCNPRGYVPQARVPGFRPELVVEL